MLPTIERLPRRSRYSSATRYPSVGLALRRPRPRVGLASGVPVASRSATRVSPRSTLTMTCFFTLKALLEGEDAALEGSRCAPLRVDRLQQADGQECGEHRRSAVAQEGQRDAGDGHDP